MWGGVADVINCDKFRENPSKGFGAVRPRKMAFPIEIVHRPYDSVGTTVRNCDILSRGFQMLIDWQISWKSVEGFRSCQGGPPKKI